VPHTIKIYNIVGARPQFIKYFPVSKAIADHNQKSKRQIKDILVHTGQHYDYDMSRIFFDELGIKRPDYHLEAGSSSHGKQTADILRHTEEVLVTEKPDIVVVYGDTNSTLGSALAACKLHIPVAHVEAGLRSYNKKMPEEMNRILTDHMSTFLFCPCMNAVRQLEKEGFPSGVSNGSLISETEIEAVSASVDANHPLAVNTGDVMYDVLLYAKEIAGKKSNILRELNLEPASYGLLTLHRAENTDDVRRFQEIIAFINETASRGKIIFPMHPRTRKVYETMQAQFDDHVQICNPVSYFDLLHLLSNSSCVFTDSGGMQKEAYWLRIPCITLRDETEWVETVESGWNVLFRDYSDNAFVKKTESLFYGQGNASQIIVKILSQCFQVHS
jgi:UDP-GlcNAc3NAcA epimerase